MRWMLIILSTFHLVAFADVDPTKLANSLSRIEENRAEQSPYMVEVFSLHFWAHPNVFSPKYFASTAIQNRHFPFKKGESFLDLGCGVGVTSVIAAKFHQNKVVALDINPDAVEITRKNLDLHNVMELTECRQSDLFSALAPTELFDTIYWDLPYVRSEESAKLDLLQRAVSDPGYRHIKKFLAQVSSHLNPNGRVILGFGSLGDRDYLETLAQESGFRVVEVASEKHPYRGGIFYSLLELVPLESSKQEL